MGAIEAPNLCRPISPGLLFSFAEVLGVEPYKLLMFREQIMIWKKCVPSAAANGATEGTFVYSASKDKPTNREFLCRAYNYMKEVRAG